MSKKWTTLMRLGSEAVAKRDYESAVQSFSEALAVAERVGDHSEHFESFTALGFAYASSKQLGKAMDTYSRCLKWCEVVHLDEYSQSICLASLAYIHRDLDQLAEAQSAALKALVMLDQNGYFEEEDALAPLVLLAELSIAAKNHGNAILYLSRAIVISRKHQSEVSDQHLPKMMELFAQIPPELMDQCTNPDAAAMDVLISQSPYAPAMANAAKR